MKGMTFQNGNEYRIQVNGESWSQGDTITGSLTVKSNSPAKHEQGSALWVGLTDGLDRKIKQKSGGAFTLLQEATQYNHESTPELNWEFKLPDDCRITDKTGSLYLVYGTEIHRDQLSTSSTIAALKLPILPHLHLVEWIEVLTLNHRFVLKHWTTAKSGWTVATLDRPAAREWASLESLLVFLKKTNDHIHVHFQFHRTEVDGSKVGLAAKISKLDFKRDITTEKLIHDFNQRLNKDSALNVIDSIIQEYRDRPLF
jgi:hypothetical protein